MQAICDVSLKTAEHCAKKFGIPTVTTDPQALISSPDIDVVFILTSDESHAPYSVAALQAGKSVMIEKSLSLSLQSAETILEAERAAATLSDARVFVGFMRRYAPSLQAFHREIASIGSIRYARVRDIIGPNAYIISQSSSEPFKCTDDIPGSAVVERRHRLATLLEEAWQTPYADLSPSQLDYCCLLATLGSHGLSLMREVLGGLPERALASTDNARWYTVMFDYRNQAPPHESFTCLYETGIDKVPRSDSSVTVYSDDKSVAIRYDAPFIKGLGITV